jgi:hypothetical protein
MTRRRPGKLVDACLIFQNFVDEEFLTKVARGHSAISGGGFLLWGLGQALRYEQANNKQIIADRGVI